MPLDPNAQILLEQMAAAGAPPLPEQTVEQARQLIEGLAALNGEGEHVAAVEDRTIAGPAGPIPVRVYRPDGADGLSPVFVWYHGGGWVIGSLSTADSTCRSLANRSGAVVVSVDYRLAPEARFPAAAHDAYAAAAWVAEHGAEIGADGSRLAIGGDSAGGNLAAVVALMARDRQGPSIALQVLVYPVTDHNFDTASYRDNADGYLLTRDSMEWFWNHYLGDGDGADPYASPLRAADLRGVAPAFVITAEFDPLRDEGDAYARRLREAGVDVTHAPFAGMIHGFFAMTLVLPAAKQAVEDVAATLRDALTA